MLYRCIRALLKVRSSSSIAGSFYATSINGSETLQATEVQAVEATKDKTLPPKISRPPRGQGEEDEDQQHGLKFRSLSRSSTEHAERSASL
jgi:hypothetical protein